MPDKFDSYREALVVEIETIWPHGCRDWSPERKSIVEGRLHATADRRAGLEYVRLQAGFRRVIRPTEDDLRDVAGDLATD